MTSSSIQDDAEERFIAWIHGDPEIQTPTFPSLLEAQRFSEIRQQAERYAGEIFANHNALFAILERNEATLRKRWIKKTADQRRKVLLTAFPAMPASHRPEFYAMRHEKAQQTMVKTRFYDSYLLPSINLEDLMKPKHLLLFLQSRGRNLPDVFVDSDLDSIRLGTLLGAFSDSNLSGYAIFLIGQTSVGTYGRLAPWADDDKAPAKDNAIDSGEGLLVLEIQHRTLEFLRKCAEIILQDLPLQDQTSPKQPAPPEIVMGNEASEWPSLSKGVLEAPYRVPDQLDVSRLQSFVTAKRSEAKDHFWFLREDPSYFQETIADWSEHRQERILSTSGVTDPVIRRDEFWERVIRNVVLEACTLALIWNLLAKDIEIVTTLREKWQTHGDADIPEDYQQALCHLEYFLERITEGTINLWKGAMAPSPPLRKHFVRDPQDPNGSNRYVIRAKSNLYMEKDYFLWLMNRLVSDDRIFICRLENLCDELDRMICSDVKNRERMSSWIADVLSNLSMLVELNRQLLMLCPSPGINQLLSAAEKQTMFLNKTVLLDQLPGILDGMNFVSVGKPLSKFNYPSDKGRNAHTTKEMQESEKNLDMFWGALDTQFIRNAGKSLHQLMAGMLDQRELQRTSDWKSIDKPQPELQSANLNVLSSQTSTNDLQERAEMIGPDSPPTPRQKANARGGASEQVSGDIENLSEPPVIDKRPKLTTSKRGYKVFSTLFYVPTEEEPPGEIPWTEFLHAMSSIGFSVKKLYGSGWVFSPVTDLFQQSIIFQEPHPSRKIRFTTARRYGRRLERTYGLTRESFVKG